MTHKLKIPEKGIAFIGYKKVRYYGRGGTGERFYKHAIVKLLIPEDAERVQYTSIYESDSDHNKCRASKAIVLEIVSMNNKRKITTGFSSYSRHFKYRVGETIVPTFTFDSSVYRACASGIHFFLTKQEAEDYYL